MHYSVLYCIQSSALFDTVYCALHCVILCTVHCIFMYCVQRKMNTALQGLELFKVLCSIWYCVHWLIVKMQCSAVQCNQCSAVKCSTVLDHLQGEFSEERLLQLEKDWIVNMGTFGPLGVNTRDQLISRTRRDWGRWGRRMGNLPISGLPGPAPGKTTICGVADSNGSVTLEF